jgi:hypothetical protein
MVRMATQVLPDVDTRPEGTDTTGDDDPKLFHYVLNAGAQARLTGLPGL